MEGMMTVTQLTWSSFIIVLTEMIPELKEG
jgi:hypothetical protein